MDLDITTNVPEVGFNHVMLFDAVAGALADCECIRFRDRHLSFAEVRSRAQRFANLLAADGITVHRPRASLAPWESGQDHVGLYLYNGNEYLEATMGSYRARAVPFNVNYRYVEAELAYLLNDAEPAALVYHATFAPRVAAVLPQLRSHPVLFQVADGSGQDLLPDAVDYEAALAGAPAEPPATEPDPTDLYMLYTGGTTGMPKGTLWTQGDLFAATFAAGLPATVTDRSSLDAVVEGIVVAPRATVMPLPPLMHGAAQWMALLAMLTGGRIVFPDIVERFDAAEVLRTIEREGVEAINLVGDAFGRPLCHELERSTYDLSSLATIVSGGAVLSPGVKERLLQAAPNAVLLDGAGASESGTHLAHVSTKDGDTSSGCFVPSPDTRVLDETMTSVLVPGHDGIGWLARTGSIPLGYLGDPEKTERTFRTVAGERVVVPGDRARLRADGLVELLGRESVTINSGGEKIFAEEVEKALVAHPGVDDVLVVGRPSERWGQEVVAVVQLASGTDVTDDELTATAAQQVARYKLPKAIVRVDAVRRSPAGKADYAWAREVAVAALAE